MHNRFLGFYFAPDSIALTLATVIKAVLLRLQLNIDKLQGYCFDGASDMSGLLTGVQARLSEQCPNALFVHCANHALDLVLQETASEVRLIADALSFVRDVSNTIRESSKRKALYESLFGEKDVVRGLHSLCPTRWCVRASAIARVQQSYPQIQETLHTLSEDRSVRADTRAKISGLAEASKSATLYFGILVSAQLFQVCEIVAKKLQGVGVTALGATENACVLIRKLESRSMRSDDTVERLFEHTQSAVEEFNLKMPGVKRLHKTCARYRQTDAAEDLAVEGMEDSWRRSYYEAVDLVSNELSRRFDQAGMKTAAQRERLLISASSQSLASVPELPPLPQNIDKRRLGLQLMIIMIFAQRSQCRTFNVLRRFSRQRNRKHVRCSTKSKI